VRVLVALGACADTGRIPAYRHFTLRENYELVREKEDDIKDVDPTPIDAHVKVDFTIPGCLPNGKEILEVVKAVAGEDCPPLSQPCLHRVPEEGQLLSPGVREALPRPRYLRRLQRRMSQRRLRVLGLPRRDGRRQPSRLHPAPGEQGIRLGLHPEAPADVRRPESAGTGAHPTGSA
jgi:hypothetical protein